MKKYIVMACFLTLRNEIVSLITLCIMCVFFLWDFGLLVGKEKW